MKKKLLIAIVAVVLAVAIPVTAFVILGDNKKPEKVDHSAQYIALESAALHNVVNTLLSGNSIPTIPTVPTKIADTAKVDISLSQNLLALMGLEGVSFADLGLPDTITAQLDSYQDGFKQDITTNILLNGQEILTLGLIADPLAGISYMTIPTISNYWLKTENQAIGELPDAASIVNGLTELAQTLPTLREPLNKYIDLALAQMKNVEKGTETITVGGKNETATVYTNYITEKVAIDVVKAVLTEAKNDSAIKSLLPVDLNLEATIDLLLGSLPEDPANDKDDAIVLKLYLDQNGKVIGRSFDVAGDAELFYFASSDSTAAKLGFVADGEGFTLELAKDSAVLYGIQQNVSVKLGSLTFSGDKENGSITLALSKAVTGGSADNAVVLKWATVDDKITFTLSFEQGAEAVDLGYLIITGNMGKGSAEVKLSDAIEAALFGSTAANLSVMMDWDENHPTTDGTLTVSLMGSSLITLRIYDVDELTAKDVEMPTNALDITNSYDLQTFTNSINLTTLRQNLLNAGISAQLIDALFAAMVQ